MRTVLSCFMTITLLIEGSAGWCCHPGVVCNCAPTDTSQTAGYCNHHERIANEGGQTAPAEPCRCEAKCQGVCVFLPPQKTQPVLLFDVWAMLPSLAVDQLAAAPLASPPGDPFDAESPVRLHLLQRTLLI